MNVDLITAVTHAQTAHAADSAILSNDSHYRYHLSRSWAVPETPTSSDARPRALFIMHNPSTADHTTNDPTIRRCITFATMLGCSGLAVINRYAYRATMPRHLLEPGRRPVGPDNDAHTLAALNTAAATAAPIIAAWGALPDPHHRTRRILELADQAGATLWALHITKDGHPGHPLYLPATSTPVRYHPKEGTP